MQALVEGLNSTAAFGRVDDGKPFPVARFNGSLSLSLLFFFFLSGNSGVASALEVWQRMAAAKWDFRMIILNPDLQQEESLCVSRFYVTLGPRFLGWLSYFSSISWRCKFRDGLSVYFLAFLLTLQEGRILLECCSGNEF